MSAYTASFFSPALIERARDTRLEVTIYVDDVATTPTSGTITITDESAVVLVSAAAVTVGRPCTYTVAAALVPTTKTLSDRWTVEWSLLMPGETQARIFRQSSALMLRRLYPVVTSDGLRRRHSDLLALLPLGGTWRNAIEEAWDTLVGRLIAKGRFPWLICNPDALREVHTYLALEIIYLDAMVNIASGAKYAELAKRYGDMAQKAWDSAVLTIDYADSGLVADAETSQAVETAVFLNGRVHGGY